MEPLIQLRNLEKVVEAGPNKFFLLRRINLDIQAGEFVTIMGPSGAGNSTLLNIVGMLDGAWTGDYYFLGEPVHKLNVKKRNELHKANIGFVFQSYHLIDNLTVFENLEVPNLHSAQGDEIMQLFKRLNEAGTTIIQVTHSERNASYGSRIIQLKDGWVVGDNATAGAPVGAAQPA